MEYSFFHLTKFCRLWLLDINQSISPDKTKGFDSYMKDINAHPVRN